ncbi:MAG TPA: efflux RND transporter permease subunit [Dissulfurispiraceae bacterium]|nr:efflux RND transporter permease subunit [Dissulfurispiraceae bacterium]
MWLADTSIKRPVFATMVIVALVVLGIVSYPRLGVDLFPKVDFPIVSVYTVLPGASPEIIDIDVTDKIEEAVGTINGVKSITSTSSEGASSVVVEFVLERNIDLAVQDVREKISTIRSKLPTDAKEPIIQKVDPDANAVLWIALFGERTPRELSTYADEVLKEKLQKVTGVGAVQMPGLRLRQVRLWLDREKMIAHGITAQDVMRLLQRENIELPSGRIESAAREYAIKVKGELRSVEAFGNLIIAYNRGAAVRLSDIGRVEDGMEEKRTIARFNGLNAVGLGIQKQSGTNTVEVVDLVKKELASISTTLPPGMKLDIAFDQSSFIKRSIKEVQGHLIIGGLFAVLAVLLFLKSLRITLISALAIPTSIISTFTIMNMFDFTFNNMTMLGLSLCIGILIDDAIIVIENIHRHIRLGKSPMEAASFATSEIGLAVMATTMAIVAIFLPVAFMKGIVGRFFLQFALTVVFAVIMSLFVSFTLTPMLASRYLSPHSTKTADANHLSALMKHPRITAIADRLEAWYRKAEAWYRALLVYAMSHRRKVVLLAVAVFILSMLMTLVMGKEFHPQEDQSRFIIRLESPVDYSVDEAEKMFRKAEDLLRKMPEVQTALYAQGLSGQINKAIVFVGISQKSERRRSQQVIMQDLRKSLGSIAGLKTTIEDISLIGGGVRNVPVQYAVQGSDLTVIQQYMRRIIGEYSKLPGIVDIDTSLETGKPELKVYIDRDKAADLGLETTTIAEAINFLIGGEVEVTKYKDESRGRRYDVRARLNPEDRKNPADLGRLYVRAKDGRLVEISNLLEIREGGGPSTIQRVDRQRAIMLFANLEGKPLGQAMDELNAISAQILTPGYTGVYKGAADIMGETFYYLIFALVLGVVLAYMILAAQFESFVHPITVLISMPFSFAGAFGALLLTGQTLNLFSFIGLILLMGLVKKNAILLVDYTNTLREHGMSRREAILEAGPVRLKPILMTTFAMVFGMLPIAVGLGEGAETRAPMAIATIGGLISSLFLTLLVVPVVYDLFDEVQERVKARLAMRKAVKIESQVE